MKIPGWFLPLIVAVATFAVFTPSLGFGFVYDDYAQIVETKQLSSVSMIPHYFTGHVWAWKTPGVPGPYYRPVFLLWLLANRMLFGLSAPLWHLTSVLTHVAATMLVYAVVKRLTGDRWAAAIAALLFGIHPIHLENVDWVSAITDPLVTVLMLGSFLCFLDGGKRLTVSYVLFALALLEKEIAIVLPLLILAYVWLFQRKLRDAIRDSLPYFLIVPIYLGVRLAVMHQLTMTMTPLPLRDMLRTWPSMLLFYARHLVWPVGLSVFYGLPVVHSADLQNFWLPCAILAAIAGGLVWWALHSRVAAFAVCFLIIPLLPALNLRGFAKVEMVHDRYLYLPSIGLCILLAMAIRRIPLQALQWGLVVPIACALAYGAVDQGQYWSDNLSLFERGVEIAPQNEIANQCLGTALLLRKKYTEAIPYYQRALEQNPNMFEALYSLGRIYFELGDCINAEPYLERAIVANATYSYPYLYYGLCKAKDGKLDVAEKALRYINRAKGPDDYREFHLALGQVLKAKGDIAGALSEFQAEARENPDPEKALQEIEALNAARPPVK